VLPDKVVADPESDKVERPKPAIQALIDGEIRMLYYRKDVWYKHLREFNAI
jgi:hypothetical protein